VCVCAQDTAVQVVYLAFMPLVLQTATLFAHTQDSALLSIHPWNGRAQSVSYTRLQCKTTKCGQRLSFPKRHHGFFRQFEDNTSVLW